MEGVEREGGVVEMGRTSSVGMATVVALGVVRCGSLKPLGARGEVVTGWSEDWPLSEEVDSPNDSTPCSTGEGWEESGDSSLWGRYGRRGSVGSRLGRREGCTLEVVFVGSGKTF